MTTTPLVMRLEVGKSRAILLGSWPVVELEVKTFLISHGSTRAKGGCAFNMVTGKKGRSATARAEYGLTGQLSM
jgi:hypothetical protein